MRTEFTAEWSRGHGDPVEVSCENPDGDPYFYFDAPIEIEGREIYLRFGIHIDSENLLKLAEHMEELEREERERSLLHDPKEE